MGHDGDNPSTPHELILTPNGRLMPAVPADGTPVAELSAPLTAAFAESSARGLLRLATEELHARLPPALDHLRAFARSFLTRLCQLQPPDAAAELPPTPPPAD